MVGLVLVAAAVLFPVNIGNTKQSAKRSMCLHNLKRIGLAIGLYEERSDGRLPLAASWMDALVLLREDWTPSSKDTNVLASCPELWKDGKSAGFGYAMNRFLIGSPKSDWQNPETIHLVYDSTAIENNASEYLPSFPLPGRHGGTNEIVYLDGHVKAKKME